MIVCGSELNSHRENNEEYETEFYVFCLIKKKF